MKRYLYYVKRGLPWSVITVILYFIVSRIDKGEWESVLGYIFCTLLFVFVAGPFWVLFMRKFAQK